MRCSETHDKVGDLLLFVTLLVGSNLGLKEILVLLVEGIPLLAEYHASTVC